MYYQNQNIQKFKLNLYKRYKFKKSNRRKTNVMYFFQFFAKSRPISNDTILTITTPEYLCMLKETN
jgi:hypothetical protein